MKQETKLKWRMRYEKVKAEAPVVIATFGVVGYVVALVNNAKMKKTQKTLNEVIDVVNNNARCGRYDRSRIEALERQNSLLLERALAETKGEGVLQ